MQGSVFASSFAGPQCLGSRPLQRRLPATPLILSPSLNARSGRLLATSKMQPSALRTLPAGVIPEKPGPGQESVWDYPRPPRMDPVTDHVVVILDGEVIAETRNAIRVLETSHPPAYYIPPQDVKMDRLSRSVAATYCEWKGGAASLDSKSKMSVAWFYPETTKAFEPIRNYVAFYPNKVDSCTVNGEKVIGQQGGFYGGWITSKVVGPFKGIPGSWDW